MSEFFPILGQVIMILKTVMLFTGGEGMNDNILNRHLYGNWQRR